MNGREGKKRKAGPSLSSQIVIGMLGGLACGLFLGEYCEPLRLVGNGFIRLMQMTILPYIVVSLIVALGRLTARQARLLALRAGILMVLFWTLTFAVILLVPLSYPAWESAAFFSSSLVTPPAKTDFLSLYIPANPFYSLANNIVPAVVLFTILMGVALISIGEKRDLLAVLQTLADALVRVTNMVVRLTPIGVFAIAATAAGTMSVQEFGRLQVYLVSFNAVCLVLSFVILPLMLQPVTPFRYRDVVLGLRGAWITAFTTGNLFVVLAVLIEECKALFRRYGLKRPQTDAYIDVLIPVSFNFPNTGKLIMLLFVLFACWFTGASLDAGQAVTFVVAGLLSFFGGVDVALPFMLNLLHLPADMYQLYVVTGVVNGRSATLLAAMHLVVFTLIATAAMTGTLHWNRRRLVRSVLVGGLVLLAMTGLLKGYFTVAVDNDYDRDKVLARMFLFDQPLPARVEKKVPVLPGQGHWTGLAGIRERGVLRVGYRQDGLPFTFFNQADELVGLDTQLAYALARDLGVELCFVPYQFRDLAGFLNRGVIDVAMGGIGMTASRFDRMDFTAPYLDLNFAFVVPDEQRGRYDDLHEVAAREDIRLAVIDDPSLVDRLERVLPKTEVVPVRSYRQFFAGNLGTWDGIVMSAEAGSAWTLLYPQYAVVVPRPDAHLYPVGFAVAQGNQSLLNYLNSWIAMVRASGEVEKAYDRWILGRGAEEKKPRWSVIRDLLHWVE